MALLTSSRNKIILLFTISIVVFFGWQYGLETAYAKTLVGATNISLGIFTNDTHIEYEKIQNQELYQFRVFTKIDGRKGNYPQETGGILQPFVIILSWMIFLFLVLKRKDAFISMGVNIGIFFLIQIIFLMMLTGYYTSTIQQFLFDIMLDSFYIIALILVIKDSILYGVFSRDKGDVEIGNREIGK